MAVSWGELKSDHAVHCKKIWRPWSCSLACTGKAYLLCLIGRVSEVTLSFGLWCQDIFMAQSSDLHCITWTGLLVMSLHLLYTVACTAILAGPWYGIYVGGFCLKPLIQNEFVPWLARIHNNTSRVFLNEAVETLPWNSFVAAPSVQVSTYIFPQTCNKL